MARAMTEELRASFDNALDLLRRPVASHAREHQGRCDGTAGGVDQRGELDVSRVHPTGDVAAARFFPSDTTLWCEPREKRRPRKELTRWFVSLPQGPLGPSERVTMHHQTVARAFRASSRRDCP
jgi:hypothetical protein